VPILLSRLYCGILLTSSQTPIRQQVLNPLGLVTYASPLDILQVFSDIDVQMPAGLNQRYKDAACPPFSLPIKSQFLRPMVRGRIARSATYCRAVHRGWSDNFQSSAPAPGNNAGPG